MPDSILLPRTPSNEILDDLDIEILLRSALAQCRAGEPSVEFHLGLLTPVEKRILLVLLCENLGIGSAGRRCRSGGGLDIFGREIFHAA
jgi:hypothetical protein